MRQKKILNCKFTMNFLIQKEVLCEGKIKPWDLNRHKVIVMWIYNISKEMISNKEENILFFVFKGEIENDIQCQYQVVGQVGCGIH